MGKIFEAQIGYNNDFIKDNRTGQYMDSFTTEDLLNNMHKENRKFYHMAYDLFSKWTDLQLENIKLKTELHQKDILINSLAGRTGE